MSMLKRFTAALLCSALAFATTALASDPTVYLPFNGDGVKVLKASRGNDATVRTGKGSTLVEGLGNVTLCNGEGQTSGSGAVQVPIDQHLAIEHGLDASKSWYLALRFRVPSTSTGYVAFYSLNNNGDAAFFKKSNSTAIGSNSWNKKYNGSLTYGAWQTLVVVGKVNDGNSAEVFLDGTSINSSSNTGFYDLSGKTYIYVAADNDGEDAPIQFDWILVGQGGYSDYEECYQKMMAGQYDRDTIDVLSSAPMNVGTPEPAYGSKQDVIAGNDYTFTMTTPVVKGNGYTATCTGWTLVDAEGVETSGSELTKTIAFAGGYYALTWNWDVEWVELTPDDYVQGGLVAQWDGIDNVGSGEHDGTSTIWKDLTGGGLDWTLDLTKCSWDDAALVFNEKRQPGTMPNKSASDFEYKMTTAEFVYKNEKNRHGVVFNPGFGGAAMLYTDTANHVGFHGPGKDSSYGNAVSLNTINSFSVRYNRTGARPTGVNCNWLNGAPGTKAQMNDGWSGGLGVPCLGGRSTNDDINPKGRLFSVRLYNRDLTDAEIARNYKIDDYRFRGGEFPGDLTFLRLSAADGTTEAKDVTFKDLATGETFSYEDFDVTFSEPDTDGNVTITAVGKDETDCAGLSGRCKIASGRLPYYPIVIDYPTNLVDVTVVGEAGKVQGDTYEFGSQVAISVAAKDGTSPFVKWETGVPAEDAAKATISFTVGELNHLVPVVALPWVYEGGALYDGYFTVSAACADDGVSLTLNKTKAPQHHIAGVNDIDFTKPIVGGYQVVAVSGAFDSDNKVTCVSLPDTVTTLGYRAFYNATALTNVNLRAESITVIGNGAFQFSGQGIVSRFKGFNGTPDVVFTNLSSIDQLAFNGCSAIAGRVELDGPAPLGFLNNPGNWTGVFEGCSGIKEARVGDAFTNVCNFCFYNCSSLTNLYLGTGIKRIPQRLTQVALANTASKLKILTLAGEIEALGSGAFINQPIESLNGGTDIVFRGLDTFGQGVFSGAKITSAVIEGKKDGVDVSAGDKINNGSFEACNVLTNVVIEGGFTGLGSFPFLKCTKLVNIELPRSFNTFTDRFFGNCNALRTVTMGAFPTSTHDRMFEGMPSNQVLFMVPDTAEWRAFAGKYVTPWSEVDAAVKAKYDAYGYPKRIPYGVVNVTHTDANGKAQTEEGIYVPNGSFFSFISPLGTLMLIK